MPGPEEEVKIVRWITRRSSTKEKRTGNCQGDHEQGGLTDFGRAWTRATIHQVLTNENISATMFIIARHQTET